jgi:hypothetical protein
MVPVSLPPLISFKFIIITTTTTIIAFQELGLLACSG